MTDRMELGPLEPRVRSHLASAEREVVLIAPFIKEAVLRGLLDVVPPGADVRVVTRWRLDEIAAGVSDLEVWPLVRDRGASLSLLNNLHAKAFIVDDLALVGSANLTRAALAGPDLGNVELLVEVDRGAPAVACLEEFVGRMAGSATDELYEVFMAAAGSMPNDPAPERSWYPKYRRPREVLPAAMGGPTYPPAQVELARAELAALGLSPTGAGVDRRVICAALSLQPLVRSLFAFTDVEGGRRFGEMRDWLARTADGADADPQALLRWVLEFLPDHFDYSRPKHSEVLRATRPLSGSPH
jgi:hypothetical protein